MLAIVTGLLSLPASADVTLHLEDGERLRGVSLEREGEFYLLELRSETVLSVPVVAVRKVKRTGDDVVIPFGIVRAEPETFLEPPGGVRLPRQWGQVEAMRDSASSFRQGWFEFHWEPSSDWSNDLEQNNFNPARWARSPIDPNWVPVSALGEDVTEFNPVHWYKPPIDPTWWPTDGFRRRD